MTVLLYSIGGGALILIGYFWGAYDVHKMWSKKLRESLPHWGD